MSRRSASCVVLPLYLDDKPTVTQLEVRLGNISNTYTEAQTPPKADDHVRGWLKRGAWHRRCTYSHNRMPFSSADRKSSLPNVFLVTACKKKKRECKKHWANYSRGRVMMVCMQWEGWRRKVGCREQYQGKSKVFPPVPKVQGNSRAYFFMYMHFIHWELYTHFDSESHW